MGPGTVRWKGVDLPGGFLWRATIEEPGGRREDGRMTRVAIIGGGIGGLTAAIALARAGVEVRVYEAAAELREIGAGVALHPNAMRVLRAIGVEDARAEGRGAVGVGGHQERDDRAADQQDQPERGRGRCRASRGRPRTGPTCSTCSRPRCPRAWCRSARGACRRSTSGDRRRSRRSRTAAEAEADVIVGADGIHSAVRTALFGPDAPRFTGKICYRSVIPAAAVRGTPAGGRQRPVAGAARHDRALPAARRGADQRRRALRRLDATGTSRG